MESCQVRPWSPHLIALPIRSLCHSWGIHLTAFAPCDQAFRPSAPPWRHASLHVLAAPSQQQAPKVRMLSSPAQKVASVALVPARLRALAPVRVRLQALAPVRVPLQALAPKLRLLPVEPAIPAPVPF